MTVYQNKNEVIVEYNEKNSICDKISSSHKLILKTEIYVSQEEILKVIKLTTPKIIEIYGNFFVPYFYIIPCQKLVLKGCNFVDLEGGYLCQPEIIIQDCKNFNPNVICCETIRSLTCPFLSNKKIYPVLKNLECNFKKSMNINIPKLEKLNVIDTDAKFFPFKLFKNLTELQITNITKNDDDPFFKLYDLLFQNKKFLKLTLVNMQSRNLFDKRLLECCHKLKLVRFLVKKKYKLINIQLEDCRII